MQSRVLVIGSKEEEEEKEEKKKEADSDGQEKPSVPLVLLAKPEW